MSPIGGNILHMIKNMEIDGVIFSKVINADSFFKRLKGLMFTKEISRDSSIIIRPCGQIHTFFMNYNIDVLYLNKDNVILDMDENLAPWRIGKRVKGAVSVVELQSGKVKRSNIKVGQAIEITN